MRRVNQLLFFMSYPHPRQRQDPIFNRKASERSSMKIPRSFYPSKPVFRLGRFAEIPGVLVRFDHVARIIVNANHSLPVSD
jgi:hypothetical protein